MKYLDQIIGQGADLTASQMAIRAVITFFIAIILVRISGRRSFSMRSAFDNVITLLLGAVLSRAIIGGAPFIPTIIASAVIAIMHRLFAYFAVTNHFLGNLIKGDKILLYEKDHVVKQNLNRALMSEHDLMEEVRLHANSDTLSGIDKVYVERSGDVSVLKQQ
jgi:uncharacterized membrane protein YcaP (DUF421 family)